MAALLDTSQLQSTLTGLGTTTSQGVDFGPRQTPAVNVKDYGKMPIGTAPSVTTTPQQTIPSLGYTVSAPTGSTPTSGQGSFTDMYRSTFNNPLQYWNEYNQGQGAKFTEGAARGMAKAGRTGMLPTLGMMAHQDYMSNYLPSVRKDLGAGLQSDTSRYGSEMGYKGQVESAGIGAAASRYGADVDYAGKIYSADLTAATNREQISAQKDMNALDNLTKTYNIDETTKANIYNSWAALAPHMTDEQRAALIMDLELALAPAVAGNETLADITAPVVTPAPQIGIGFIPE